VRIEVAFATGHGHSGSIGRIIRHCRNSQLGSRQKIIYPLTLVSGER
jgi:hypothetical protein